MRTGRQCRGLGWDHPRVGGEKVSDGESVNRYEGSPPHGRGKAFSVLRRQFRFRITPAHAGKSRARKAAEAVRRDHPRVGGEKDGPDTSTVSVTGSPLHGRGKEDRNNGTAWLYRITPAWAGKRTGASASWTTVRDHPRMGGEKAMGKACAEVSKGSPPRGRGKDQRAIIQLDDLRITPAWAGKRHGGRVCCWNCWDHPRVGGEKLCVLSSPLFVGGSPPRRRGKAFQPKVTSPFHGITPA